jgi:hypothetical protein
MLAVYDDASSSKYQIKYLFKHFKWGRDYVKDEPCPGKRVGGTAQDMCQNLKTWPCWTGV